MTSFAEASIAFAISGFNLPAFRLVMAAARLIFARFLMKTGCNFVPVIGKFSLARKKAASLAKESLKTDIPVKTLVLKYGLLKESELDSILDPYAMTEARTRQTQAKAV